MGRIPRETHVLRGHPLLADPKPFDGTRPVTDWAEAQGSANFVLLRPKAGGAATSAEATLRGESRRHYSTLRTVVTLGGRRFRIKQGFNDWWVPVSNEINLRRVEGHVLLGDEVVFLGRDYHGKPGACAQIHGTTVEAYAMDGPSPGPDDWRDLFSSLEPAHPPVLSVARRTTFAERDYWMRWHRDVGPWDSHEFTRPQWMRPDPETFETVAWASTPDRWAPMPGAPDSIASLSDGNGQEMQVLFRQPMTLNYTSWLRIREPPDADGPVARRDPRYPQRWTTAKIGRRDVEAAALQDAVGPWFFAWTEGQRSLEFHVRARRGLDAQEARRILETIIA